MSRTRINKTRRQLLSGLAGLTGLLAGSAAARAACIATPYQVTGPFYPEIVRDDDWDMTRVPGHRDRAEGKIIEVAGRILDSQCRPVQGAVIDIWQANAAGRYLHARDPNPAPLDPNFEGFARLVTGEDGRYRVLTIVPGAYPVGPGTMRPPHIHFKVHPPFAETVTTQMYFAGHPLNEKDGLFMSVPEALRPMLAIDLTEGGASNVPGGTFDVHVGSALPLPGF